MRTAGQAARICLDHPGDFLDRSRAGVDIGLAQFGDQKMVAAEESERPNRFDSPLIGLFLLICDLALNPGSGFPFPVR